MYFWKKKVLLQLGNIVNVMFCWLCAFKDSIRLKWGKKLYGLVCCYTSVIVMSNSCGGCNASLSSFYYELFTNGKQLLLFLHKPGLLLMSWSCPKCGNDVKIRRRGSPYTFVCERRLNGVKCRKSWSAVLFKKLCCTCDVKCLCSVQRVMCHFVRFIINCFETRKNC
jgi:hypothetical protein